MAPTLNRHDLVQQCWPYDGPHDEETITSAAEATDELVRYLNNASLWHLPAPTLYETLGSLTEALGRMRRLVQLYARTAEGYSDDPTLRHDADCHAVTGRAAVEAVAAAENLWLAVAPLVEAAEALNTAHQELSHLYHDNNQPEGGGTR